MNNNLNIYTYELKSSADISGAISKLSNTYTRDILIHIISYMHNTVMVHKLQLELKKLLPYAEIVLLKTDEKLKTTLKVYDLDKNANGNSLSDLILRETDDKLTLSEEALKQSKINLMERYFTDHLTNLPNIYQLRKDLQEHDNRGIVLIKIDDLSIINNFYGFIVGDFIIEKVGEFLKNSLKQYTIYRHTGAEFVIIIENNLSFYEHKELLEKTYQDIKNLSIMYQDIKIFIELTLASSVNTTHKDIFSKVSMALKYASENNLPYWIYEDNMNFENAYEKNLKISNTIRYALENSKVIPYFQPIIDNKTMKVTKFECLARLIDENGHVIAPDFFISIAKKIKLYKQITKMIVNKSFEAFENNNYEFNINISIEDIMSREIFDFIINKLKSSKSSSRVTFELLESEAIKDFDKVDKFIREAKRYGAKIAIDDFGDGYSNFSYITNINADYIKIDGSLISDIDTNKNSFLIVESIVDFAKKIGILTVAEYVHSSPVFNKVKELGIDYSQGFFIDKPSVNLDIDLN